MRSRPWIRLTAALMLAFIFWLDLLSESTVPVPALYVLPTLLCVWARRAYEPLVAAALATVLTFAGLLAAPGSPDRGVLGSLDLHRPLELLIVWAAAGMIGAYLRQKAQWQERDERASMAMAASLKGLDEIRYALDQAAIVAATDHRGAITYANDKFCEISKYSRDELIGQDHRIINSGTHPKEFMRELWQTIARGQVWRGEIRNRAKDGSLYWVDTTIVPFLDGRGKPRQYLSIRSDITQRKAAEAQIRQQSALTQLGAMAAVVAHEVRNPLAGLRASLQVLDRRFEPAAREHDVIAAMIQRIDNLNEKVEDLLFYARPKPPRLQPVDVKAVAEEVSASARAAVGARCAPISISANGTRAYADPDMLRAALLNLTMNACQVSESEPVEIEVTAFGERCRIAVRDRGPGIAPDVRERIFEPFFTTRAGGTGLGLAIVKRLMDVQGGTIALSDRPGGGTVAEMNVPLAPIATPS